MAHILVLKHLDNLSDEPMKFQLLDRLSCQRFSLLTGSANVPDSSTIWLHQQHLGINGKTMLFQAVDRQLLRHGDIARGGQIVDATLVKAPIQHFTRGEVRAYRDLHPYRRQPLRPQHAFGHGQAVNGLKQKAI